MSEQAPARKFSIEKVYLKDLSFESPRAPQAFLAEWKPEVDMNLHVEHQPLDEGAMDVTVLVTATVKNGGENAFLVEVKQSGIFLLSGFSEEDTQALLNVECPALLFPYAREVVSDTVTRSGFPPLLLQPLNFAAIYAQKMQEAAQQASTATH